MDNDELEVEANNEEELSDDAAAVGVVELLWNDCVLPSRLGVLFDCCVLGLRAHGVALLF